MLVIDRVPNATTSGGLVLPLFHRSSRNRYSSERALELMLARVRSTWLTRDGYPCTVGGLGTLRCKSVPALACGEVGGPHSPWCRSFDRIATAGRHLLRRGLVISSPSPGNGPCRRRANSGLLQTSAVERHAVKVASTRFSSSRRSSRTSPSSSWGSILLGPRRKVLYEYLAVFAKTSISEVVQISSAGTKGGGNPGEAHRWPGDLDLPSCGCAQASRSRRPL